MAELQTMPKPFAVFDVKRGRNGLTDPQLHELFDDETRARGRVEWLERNGGSALIVDLREAAYSTPGMAWEIVE